MTTRRDVAEMAGVSQSTVSRVVNKNGYVAEEVRDKVLKVIEESGYIPNRAARSLRMKHYRQVACVVQSITNPFYSEIVEGVEEVAARNGYTFSLYKVNPDNPDQMKFLLEGSNDGIIMLSPIEIKKTESLEQISNRVPTVLYRDFQQCIGISHVYVDLKEAMKTAVTHLIEKGHEKITFLGYEFQLSPNTTSYVKDPRYLGYLEAMEENNLAILPEFLQFIELDTDTLSTGYERALSFIKECISFTAIVAANDLLAIGVMRALVERGKKVPEDISLIGMDDIELARLTSPSLTSVHIPKRIVGNQLMDLLLKKINGKEKSTLSLMLDVELIERESVARVPSATISDSLKPAARINNL